MKNTEKTMEKIVALCKNRGFVFPGSEIYGGLANTWDYGPLGAELKKNIKNAWWKKFVQENPYNVGLDAAILMNPQTWVASGHLGGFSDPLMDCRECHERFRADKDDISLHHALRSHGSGPHEQLGRVKPGHKVIAGRCQNDVLLGKNGSPRHGQARAGLAQQCADDVQRIGQHLQVEAGQMRAHLQGRRTAIHHDRLAMRT